MTPYSPQCAPGCAQESIKQRTVSGYQRPHPLGFRMYASCHRDGLLRRMCHTHFPPLTAPMQERIFLPTVEQHLDVPVLHVVEFPFLPRPQMASCTSHLDLAGRTAGVMLAATHCFMQPSLGFWLVATSPLASSTLPP